MWTKGEYFISTDKSLLNFAFIHGFISTKSYWGQGRSIEKMTAAIDNSILCFGLYQTGTSAKQIGFARVISDLATFAYIADVFVCDEYRNQGLGKWLIQTLVNHSQLTGLRRIALFTRTPDFYSDLGFTLFEQDKDLRKFMERYMNTPSN